LKKKVLSIVVPAYNEEENIAPTVREIALTLKQSSIPFEFVLVNDNSKDKTPEVIQNLKKEIPQIQLVNRTPPGGFGRAIRTGIAHATGDYVVIVMADLSDDPKDIVSYYHKLEEGYDCVFGSRFIPGSNVQDYPKVKLFVNRIVNRFLQVLFWSPCNDLTNAFKAYKRHVIQSISPLKASHFNITIEMSLSALIREYKIAVIPIAWYGRKWGSSNLRLRQMGRRYLATLLMIFFQRWLVKDDLMAENSHEEEELERY